MKAELTILCDKCIEDLTFDARVDFKLTITDRLELRDKIKEQGWKLGRRCLCPDCAKEVQSEEARCENCKHWHPLGYDPSYCLVDGERAVDTDTCRHFEHKEAKHGR